MQLYQRSPDQTLRISITKRGMPTEYFTVWQCTVEEAHTHFQKVLVAQKLPMSFDKVVTSIVIRETVGGKNGKAKSFSFKGLTPKETKDILIKSIK